MDNASKALIMAGQVLIAGLVISLFLFAVNSFREYNNKTTGLTESAKMESFNRYFLYASSKNGGRINGYDAYNVAGKALDMNQTLDPADQITITIGGVTINSYNALAPYKNNNTWLEQQTHTYRYDWRTKQ